MAGGIAGGMPGWLTGIAAGPIVAALAGAGAMGTLGGLIGGMVGLGIPEYEARRYEGRIREGGVLLSVHCDDTHWVKRAKTKTRCPRKTRNSGRRGVHTLKCHALVAGDLPAQPHPFFLGAMEDGRKFGNCDIVARIVGYPKPAFYL